jgi:peroxisomal membrane protein 2
MGSEQSPLLLYSSLVKESAPQGIEQPCQTGAANNQDEVLTLQNPHTRLSLSRSLSETWDSYYFILEKHPLLVKSITAFFILGGGDLCGQGLEHWRGTAQVLGIDWVRAGRFAIFGLIGAPWSHFYFHYLDYFLPPSEHPFSVTTALKLLIDQGIQAPALLAVIISALSILKGEGLEGANHDLSINYMDALYANCKLQCAIILRLCTCSTFAFRAQGSYGYRHR